MHNQKLFSYIGFALRARLCSKGTDAVLGNIRSKKADVVILDASASENTQKKIKDACKHHQIFLVLVEQEALYRHTKENIKVLSIQASPLSEQIKRL